MCGAIHTHTPFCGAPTQMHGSPARAHMHAQSRIYMSSIVQHIMQITATATNSLFLFLAGEGASYPLPRKNAAASSSVTLENAASMCSWVSKSRRCAPDFRLCLNFANPNSIGLYQGQCGGRKRRSAPAARQTSFMTGSTSSRLWMDALSSMTMLFRSQASNFPRMGPILSLKYLANFSPVTVSPPVKAPIALMTNPSKLNAAMMEVGSALTKKA
eukprot:CAMPEP_0170166586 /NCGR_PEP_ID=MMETSP0040_2-20121228/238_1 /TAXON_ID=641309 /ORGANISM="Lotharella oceanica, Strain CCMP622" /LENGTH=214 /DNA_ID=CAMNT_0010404347 /DNA_START=85 /DNA_END=729 /DNA_ORIENTATION=-